MTPARFLFIAVFSVAPLVGASYSIFTFEQAVLVYLLFITFEVMTVMEKQ